MAYTAPQIGVILLKADRTMYKIGQIAYENMFAEDNEALDYERDVIFIYKKAVEFADDFFVGTEKLDKVVERLATKISAYDYGELNPIYADAATINTPVLLPGSALNDLTDVTIANLLDNQLLRYNAATGQWINVGPGAAVRNSQAFTATAGQTVFTTSYPFDAGLFDLYVNGVKLNSLSYTTMGEYQITLNDPCIAGDIVDVVIYDSYTGINPSIGSLNDLTDVSIGALANNQALYYNSATGLWQNGLVFVPYTGATASVDLGEFEIRAGQFTLDTSPTGTATVGTTRWNDTIGSSETTLKGGSVILKNGVDLVARVVNKVTPNTTLTKASYAAVRISGAQGQRLAVAYAQANNDANSADTIGLVTETIATNQEGFIMTMGSLEGINTTGSLQGETWADGDVLYLSPTVPGGITNVKPTGLTGHIVVVGYVEYAHANNGKIYVKTMNGWELDELHNVNINTGTLANGDVLKYNSTTQLWENGVSTAGISGSGAAGQVTYWTGASAVSGSNNLFWDNTNGRLGIGTNAPASPLHIVGNSLITGQSTFGGNMTISLNHNQTTKLTITNTQSGSISEASLILTSDATAGVGVLSKYSNTTGAYKTVSAADTLLYNGTKGDISILNDFATGRIKFASGGGSTPQMTLFANGNLAINSGVSDLGVKFGVVGDTLLRGSGNTSTTTALTVQNSGSVNMLRLLNDNTLKIGSQNIDIFPTADGSAVSNAGRGLIISTSAGTQTTGAVKIVGSSTLASGNDWSLWLSHSFAPASGTATHSGLLLNQTINQTGGANGITRGLYINPTLTAAADFRAIETSAGNVLFGSNFFWDNTNGRLGIGTNAPNRKMQLVVSPSGTSDDGINIFNGTNRFIFTRTGSSYTYCGVPANAGMIYSETNISILSDGGNITLHNSGGERLRLDTSGNIGIGITPTVRLHVSGDTILRGSGATSATTALTVQNSSSTDLMTVRNDGLVVMQGSLGFGTDSLRATIFTGSTSNRGIIIQDNSGVTGGVTTLTVGNNTKTGTLKPDLNLNSSWTPTTSTFTYAKLSLTGTYTELAGQGASQGIYINTTIGATTNYRAIEWTNNNGWGLYGSGTAANFLGGSLRVDGVMAQGGATAPDVNFYMRRSLSGSVFPSGIYMSSVVSSTSTTGAGYFATDATTQAASFTLPNLYHYFARQTAFGAGSTVTNQYGFFVEATLTGATNNYGFYGSIASGTGRWNLYMNGTADNYLAGRLGIGTTSITKKVNIVGDVLINTTSITQPFALTETSTGYRAFSIDYAGQFLTQINFGLLGRIEYEGDGQYMSISNRATAVGSSIRFITGTTEKMVLANNGNLGIGITPTVKLHVSGDTILLGSGATSATTALTVQNSSSQNIITIKNNRTSNMISDAGQLNIASSADGTNGLMEFDANSSNTQTVFVQLTRGTVGFASTAINQTAVRINGGFAPTSGTATWHSLHVNPTINQTGGANGITRGLYVNPTLTSAADFRAIETTNGKIVFGNLPTSSAGLPTGALWNDAGTVKIV